MSGIRTAPNTFLFGPKFTHNAQGVLHGDECALCGKRTHAGRGVQFVGYVPQTNEVLHPSNIAEYNALGGAQATLVLVGEDCYYRNRATIKPYSATVRTALGCELATSLGLDSYLPVLRNMIAPTPQPSAEVAPVASKRGKRRAKATAG